MNGLIIGLYGVFLLAVGFSGNASALAGEFKQDAGGFLSWAIGIAVLAVMVDYPATEKIAKPFILLLVLNFLLRNFDALRAEYQKLIQFSQGN